MELLSFLYGTAPGRLLLRPLVSRPVSEAAGKLLDSGISRLLVRPFVRRAGIDTEEYLPDPGRSFNDFFCRAIRPEKRPVDTSPERLVAPCDGLLTAYPVREGLVFPVKQARYTVADLLRSGTLARRFDGGWCLVFRLCVHHYHRYVYAESGVKGETRKISGIYHTVRPVALRGEPVFCENTREYTVLETETAGTLVQMEVGAMLVGRIVNRHPEGRPVRRGEEKGYFAYGGSTIILLTEPGRFLPHPALSDQYETPVLLGSPIGILKALGNQKK